MGGVNRSNSLTLIAGRMVKLEHAYDAQTCRRCDIQEVVMEDLFQAIEESPELVLPHVDALIAFEVVERYDGVYHFLPETVKSDKALIYAALERDEALQA